MIDPKEIEPKWQMRWREAQAFEADPDSQRPKFYLTVPYPYANAPMHVGHGRTYTLGDIIARYKRMSGYNVLWPMAAHVTGTPVAGVANRIRAKDPEILKDYRINIGYWRPKKDIDSVLATFTDPKAIAQFFVNVFEGDFRKLGYSIDWRRKFTTNDPEYHAFVTWQFINLQRLGYITKGNYPILYCVNCGNAVGEDDLLVGEHAKVAEFVAIKFPYEDGYLIAATLRPETVYGVTNVWINPTVTYMKLQVGEEIWYTAQPAARKLVNQGHKSKRIEEIPGTEFIGKTCKSPVEDRDLPILPAEFVDPENATGIVYSVPSHAPFDWAALRDLQKSKKAVQGFKLDFEAVKAIQPISIIAVEGYGEHPAIELIDQMKIKSQKATAKLDEATETLYRVEFYQGVMKDNTGPFVGRKVSEIKEDVITHLQEENRGFRFYQPDQKPVTCRCGNEIVVAVLPDQWFINYGNAEWKAKASKALEQMLIFPEMYRKLFESTFDWLKERPAARKRGLGTRLPFDRNWVIESLSDSTIYMAFYLIINHIRSNQINPRQLDLSFFDYVLLGKGDINQVAEKTDIPTDLLQKMRNEVDYWYPNDERHTAVGHIPNHLSFFIFHHAALFPERYWPKAITLNEFVIRDGEKMSKSKGNFIPMSEIPRRYGADLYRLYISQIGDLQSLVDWKEKDVNTVQRRIKRLIRILDEASKIPDIPLNDTKLSMMSRWILSKINTTIRDATDSIEHFRFRTFILQSFFQLQSHVEFYLRQIKKDNPERNSVLRYIITRWNKLLAPVMPHLCEEVWERLGSISFVSLENWPTPDEKYIDEKIEKAMEVVSHTIADIKEIKGLLKGKKIETVHIYVSPTWKYGAFNKLAKADVPPTVKDLMPILMKDAKLRKRGKEVNELVQVVAKAGGYWTFVDKKTEINALKENSSLIQAETGLTIDVQDGDNPTNDPEKRAPKALPGRPALFLE
ncbi:MAG: leucine--tRNA ligase [Candidatus Hermodarchaeota archaeon]|nr:leucine--tRNA ligase [Candidatus Hermodarchaeota archaeon]